MRAQPLGIGGRLSYLGRRAGACCSHPEHSHVPAHTRIKGSLIFGSSCSQRVAYRASEPRSVSCTLHQEHWAVAVTYVPRYHLSQACIACCHSVRGSRKKRGKGVFRSVSFPASNLSASRCFASRTRSLGTASPLHQVRVRMVLLRPLRFAPTSFV